MVETPEGIRFWALLNDAMNSVGALQCSYNCLWNNPFIFVFSNAKILSQKREKLDNWSVVKYLLKQGQQGESDEPFVSTEVVWNDSSLPICYH
jgi:hypothetical protein